MRIPGTTGSDKHLRFVDDGLEIKYAGLMQQLQDVGDEIYQATELLPSAQAEIAFSERWWRSPRFPVQSYAFVFRCASKLTSRTCGASPVSDKESPGKHPDWRTCLYPKAIGDACHKLQDSVWQCFGGSNQGWIVQVRHQHPDHAAGDCDDAARRERAARALREAP